MRDYRDYDHDHFFTYGRPSVSSWIAAAAVAFAVFVLGGFIKTYRQLEKAHQQLEKTDKQLITLREESRREIRQLRTMLENLGTSNSTMDGYVGRSGSSRMRNEPGLGARHQEEGYRQTPASRSTAANSNSSLRYLAGLEDTRPGLTFELGRRSDLSGQPQSHLMPLRVHTRSNDSRQIMIDGGTEAGIEKNAGLEVFRDGRWVAELRVLEAFDTHSVCEITHAVSPPQQGDLIRVR